MNAVIQQIEDQLRGYVPNEELRETTYWILEETTGCNRTDILCGKCTKIVPEIADVLRRLQRKEPIQYIFGHTYWRGMCLRVNPSVLIPRPETSELVDWILTDCQESALSLIDAGTGSGCIAVAIARERTKWQIMGIDISEDALSVAAYNGKQQKVNNIEWLKADMLHLPSGVQADVLVSNPPYIMEQERSNILPNVLNYEPHTALFVSDADPLLFYRAIAMQHRAKVLYFEINPLQAEQMTAMLQAEGYTDIELRCDMQGHSRMIKAQDTHHYV